MKLKKIFGGSTEGETTKYSLPALVKKAKQAVCNAELCRTPLQKFSYALCNAVGVSPEESVVMGPVKSTERIIQKAIARYDGDITRVSDVCRDQILIDSPDMVKMYKDAMNTSAFRDAWEEKGIVVTNVEDFFARPSKTTGWSGLVLKLEIDLGKGRTQKAEIQIIPREMLAIYETTHSYQEQIREIYDVARTQNRDLSKHEREVVAKHQSEAQRVHYKGMLEHGYLPLRAQEPAQHVHELTAA